MKTISNYVLFVVFSLLSFGLFSCSEDDPAPVPTVNIGAGDATDASITFTVTAENATKAAWVCVKKGETVPTVEGVLSNGKSVDASKTTSITVADLEHNASYVVAVAVEGEGGSAYATKEMKTVKAPDPTVAVAIEGEATESSFAFKATVANATKVAYKCIEAGEAVPAVATILSEGTAITDLTKAVEVKNLKQNTKYEVYVAVEGRAGQLLSEPLKVTTKQQIINIEFTESHKTGNGNNFYVTFQNSEYTLKADFYTTIGSKYLMPGTYKLAGTKEMETDIKWTDLTPAGASKSLFTEGEIKVVIVEKNTYEITTNLVLTSGEIIKAHYKGEITGIIVEEEVDDTYTLTVSAAKRISTNDMIAGEYNIAMNDKSWNFEMRFDFYADPTSTELPAGTYTLASSKAVGTLGTNSSVTIYDKREFTTSFDDSGTVEVTKAGDTYTFKINLKNKKGQKYTGGFTGKIANMSLAN